MNVLSIKDLFKNENKKSKPAKVKYNKKNKSPIYQLIALSIREELADRVILGKRGDEIFICYKEEQLAKFFKDWFGVQKLRRDNQVSDDFYLTYVQSTLEKADFEEFLEDL